MYIITEQPSWYIYATANRTIQKLLNATYSRVLINDPKIMNIFLSGQKKSKFNPMLEKNTNVLNLHVCRIQHNCLLHMYETFLRRC